MKKPNIITGLDLGSSRISAVAAEVNKNGSFEVLAQVSSPSKGILKGVLVDLGEAADSVSKALTKLSEKISARPDNIYVNISGPTIKAERSKGMIPLSVRGREVTKSDMDRCVNVASTIRLTFDRDIIHRIVLNFSIDDQPSIKNPLGLYASRLACEMYVISASVNHIQNIYKCVNDAGYDIKEVVFTGIADGISILTKEEKENGTILLNIGASLTELSVFSGGVLNDIDVITLGTQDFKEDLKNSVEFNNTISKIIMKKEGLSKKGEAIKHIALTGGLAFVDGIIEILEEKLGYPVRVGIARGIKGDISSTDSIKLATAIGLIRYAEDKYRKKVLAEKNVVQHITTRVVDIFNNYF